MQTDPVLLDRAKAMRREMTQPEKRLWYEVRAKRVANTRFSKQVVIDRYIADFARSQKLVVEVDGDTHADPMRDAARTNFLEAKGYRVVRLTNDEVMGNLEGVLQSIAGALAARLPQPSPRGGVG